VLQEVETGHCRRGMVETRSSSEANHQPARQKNFGSASINWSEILPTTAIAKSRDEKIKQFRERN